jgi:hypothetical protein
LATERNRKNLRIPHFPSRPVGTACALVEKRRRPDLVPGTPVFFLNFPQSKAAMPPLSAVFLDACG